MNAKAKKEEELTYTQAVEELDDLLEELERADVDVDHLADRVARGAQLVRFCRERLDVVTSEVDGVVAELVSTEDLTDDDYNDEES